MKDFAITPLLRLASELPFMYARLADQDTDLSAADREQARVFAGAWLEQFTQWAFHSCADLCRRILAIIEVPATTPLGLAEHLRDLERRFQDETQRPRCFLVDAAMAPAFASSALLRDKAANWQAAVFDLEESGWCWALDRPTATVMHLMRAVEVSLQAVAKSLGVPHDENWETIINNIRGNLNAKRQNRALAKDDDEFYQGVLTVVGSLKIFTRNPTMHVRGRYTIDQATLIFSLVSGLIQHVATKLNQDGARIDTAA